MAYNYTPGTFSDRDVLPPLDPDKEIKGQHFEDQFLAIDPAIKLNMPKTGGAFSGAVTGTTLGLSGTLTGVGATFSGTVEANLIDGGTY